MCAYFVWPVVCQNHTLPGVDKTSDRFRSIQVLVCSVPLWGSIWALREFVTENLLEGSHLNISRITRDDMGAYMSSASRVGSHLISRQVQVRGY